MSEYPAVVLRDRGRIALRVPGFYDVPGLLREMAGSTRVRVDWSEDRSAYLMSRNHAEPVILGLARIYGLVTVFQYGDPAVTCGPLCLAARSPRYMCECSCLGRGHGEEAPPSVVPGSRDNLPGVRVVEEVPDHIQPDGRILRRYSVRAKVFRSHRRRAVRSYAEAAA